MPEIDIDPSPRAPDPGLGRVRTFASGVYIILLLVGLLWCYARTGRGLPDSLTGGDAGTSLALGLGTAAIVIVISAVLMKRMATMRWFAEEVRRLLGPIDTRTALHLAIVSGISEEVFFRGVMQPAVGFVGASLVFGLVHVGPDVRYLSWTIFAVAMGFVLGGMLEATGSLAGPVVAHIGVNFVNLRHIGRMSIAPAGVAEPSEFSG